MSAYFSYFLKKVNTVSLKSKIIILFIRIIGLLPLSWVRHMGAAVARLSWMIRTRDAKVTQTNIDMCFPLLDEQQRRGLARQSLVETGKLALEICSVWMNDRTWLQPKLKKTHGEQLLVDALAKQKGVIVLAPHFGNWEVLGRFLPNYAQTTNLYQPPKQAFIEPLMRASRGRDGAVLAPASLRGVSQLLAALKKGGITGILPDQCPDQGSGIFSPFCGHSAYTITLVHGLLQRTGCQVLLAAAKRVKNGFEIYYIEPDKAIYSDDVQTSVDALNKTVETCIALAPEQYQWEYKRFKKQPEGQGKLYQYK